MKNFILFFLIFISIQSCLYSQTSFDLDPLLISNDTAQQIREIDKFKDNINLNINNFQKIEKYKDSLNFRHVYLKDNVLQLIKVQHKVGSIIKNIEWFYLNNQLFYTEANWVDTITNKNINHAICYLYNDHLIAWINNDNKFVNSKSAEFKDYEIKIATYGKALFTEAMK